MAFPGVKMYGHAGDAYGLISDTYIDPETNYGIIFITNGPKNSDYFKYSNESAFFEPEALTFDALGKYSRPNCSAPIQKPQTFLF